MDVERSETPAGRAPGIARVIPITLCRGRHMEALEFSKEEKSELVARIKGYLSEELDLEIGSFDAEFLLDFITTELGAYFYNRGLYDAQALFSRKVDEFSDAVYELEQPTGLRK